MQSLADKAGVSVQAIYKWFRGDGDPSIDLLRKLSRALGVPLYLLVAVYEAEDIHIPELEFPVSGGRVLRLSVHPDLSAG
jgi:transcriptional regulator with XRE-family HTH domain